MPTTNDQAVPTWDQTEDVPAWDDTTELAAPEAPKTLPGLVPWAQKFLEDPYQKAKAQLPPGMQMGPFGPIDPSEGVRVFPEVAGAISKAGEQLTQPLADMGADFLRRTGIDPSAQPDKPLLDLTPKAPATPDEGFIRGALRKGSEIASGFTTPRQALTLPFLPFKLVQGLYGAEAIASLPQSLQEFSQAQTPGELGAAVTGAGANLTMAGLIGRSLLAKKAYASQNRETGPLYEDVRTQPREGQGQVPVEEGGAGIQPRTAGEEAEVLLKPHLENNRAQGLGYGVQFHDDVEPGNIHENAVAWADAPVLDENGDFVRPGSIHVNRAELQAWLESIPKEKHADALAAMVSEEGIHSMITDHEAELYGTSLTKAEQGIGQALYLGDRAAEEIQLTGTQLAHELLRQRMQRLMRMEPTEIAEAAGKQRWGRRSLEVIASLVRQLREVIGTRAAKTGKGVTEQLLKRIEENIGAAAEGVYEEAPAPAGEQPFSIRRTVPKPEEETNDPAEMAKVIGPVKFDGIMDFKLPGLKPKWQFTLTTPGRQTTFMLDVGSSLKDVWRKTSIKDYQFEHHIGDVAEAERRWLEENPEAGRPATIRRQKGQKQEELNLPPVTIAPRGKSELQMREAQTGQEPKTLPGMPQAGTAEVPGGPPVREGELPLPNVPAGAGSERGIPRPRATPGGLEQEAGKWVEEAIGQGQAPSYKTLSDKLRGQFGPGISGQEAFGAIGRQLMKLSGEQLESLLDSMGLRSKHPGAMPEPVDVPKEHQAQFEALAQQFPHKKVPTPRAVRQAFSPVLRRRYDAIGSILDKLSKEAQPELRKAWDRAEVGPEQIQQLAGERLFRPISATEAANPEVLGEIATRGAAMEASGKGAPPRTVSKNLLALSDKSGRVILVSAFKDPRSGPRVTNPGAEALESRKIDNSLIGEYRPISVMTLREPVKNFRKVFDSREAFNKWFGEAGIEGTPGLRTSSFVGPQADVANIQAGVTPPGAPPRPPRAPLPEALQTALGQGFELPRGEMLTTPGRPPIRTGTPIYRSPRPAELPSAPLSLKARQDVEAQARAEHPYEPTKYEPSPGLEARNISIMPGARGKRPGTIRRNVADELENLKDQMIKATKRGAFAQLLSAGVDSAENTANNLSRQAETAIRMASQVKAKWHERDIKGIPVGMPEGDPQVLAAANVLVESGFDNLKIADFKQMVANGRTKAEAEANSANWRERRAGRAWLRALDAADRELDYAEKNWNNPQLQDAARRMKQELDDAYKRERKAGIKMKKDPAYLPHRYVMLDKPGVFGRKYRLPQTFDTYYNALENGPYLPVTRDGATLVSHRVAQGLRRIQQGVWKESLKNIDVEGRPLSIDPLYDPKTRKWTNPDIDYETVDQHGGDPPLLVLKEYNIPKVVRSLTSRNVIEDTTWTRGALHLSQKLKHTLLIGDFFHLARVLYYAASIMRGKTGYAGGWSVLDIADHDIPEAVRKGYISQADADWGAESVDFTQPGGPHETITRRQLAQKFYREMGANLGKIQDALYKDLIHKHDPRQGAIRAGVARAIDPTVGRYNRVLFDKLTRGLMSESAVREFERQHADRPDVAPERLMRDIAKDVNTYYGNLGRQGVLKAKWQQDLARIFWLAPQWVEGLVRKEATAYSRWSGASQLMGRRGLTYAGTTGRGIATGLGFMFGLTQAINFLSRGHSTFQNKEKGHQLDAWIPGFGHDNQGFWLSPLAVFNELTHDLYRLYEAKGGRVDEALRQIAGNKQSPLFRAAAVGMSGKTPTGEIITSGAGTAAEMGKQLLPLPITFGRYAQAAGHAIAPGLVRPVSPQSLQRQAAGTLGLKIEPAATPSQRVHEMAKDFMKAEGLEKTTGWQEIMTDEPSYSKLRNALRQDDPHGAEKVFKGILAHNHSEEDVLKAMRAWTERGFTGNQQTEQAFMKSLTPEELEQYSQALEGKQALYEKFLEWYLNR